MEQPSWSFAAPQMPSFAESVEVEFKPVNMMDMMPNMNSYMPHFENLRLFWKLMYSLVQNYWTFELQIVLDINIIKNVNSNENFFLLFISIRKS